MMHVWHFSEMAYHPAWPHLSESYRVIIPSRLFDPKLGADLYHRYLDEWALCDELGINIMINPVSPEEAAETLRSVPVQ